MIPKRQKHDATHHKAKPPNPKHNTFALRLSEDILGAMQRWADDELRSANAQIEWALREALRNAGRLPRAADPEDRDKT